MQTELRPCGQPIITVARIGIISLLALATPALQAQFASAENFDIERFSDYGAGWFETFYVDETQSLQSALDEGNVAEDSAVLVTETADGQLALLTDQMAFHHIAEGTVNGKDWMATF